MSTCFQASTLVGSLTLLADELQFDDVDSDSSMQRKNVLLGQYSYYYRVWGTIPSVMDSLVYLDLHSDH